MAQGKLRYPWLGKQVPWTYIEVTKCSKALKILRTIGVDTSAFN